MRIPFPCAPRSLKPLWKINKGNQYRRVGTVRMKIAMVTSQTTPELLFNAFRLANVSRKEGDEVKVFLLAEGVELDGISNPNFDVRAQAESFLQAGGQILACGTCLKLRNSQGSELCPLSTMKDLYTLIREADRVVTF